MSYQEGAAVGNAMMGVARTIGTIQGQAQSREKMDWQRRDRAKSDQADEYLGFITAGDNEGLQKAVAARKENGDYSEIAMISAGAQADTLESQAIGLRSQRRAEDAQKIALERAKYDRFLENLSITNPKDLTQQQFAKIARGVSDNPDTDFHVDIAKDGAPTYNEKTGKLSFTMRDSEGKPHEYSRPWNDAILEAKTLHGTAIGQAGMTKGLARLESDREFSRNGLLHPTILTNDKNETAATYTVMRKGQKVTFTTTDAGKLIAFDGNFEDMSDRFKKVHGATIEGVPAEVPKGWKGTAEMASRAAAKEGRKAMDAAGGTTLDEIKKRLDISEKQYKVSLDYFKQKEDNAYNADGTLDAEGTDANAVQRAFTALEHPENKEAYEQALLVVKYRESITGKAKLPIDENTVIDAKWLKDTFSKKTEADQMAIYQQASPEQRTKIESMVAAANGTKPTDDKAKPERDKMVEKKTEKKGSKEKSKKAKPKLSKKQKELLTYFCESAAKENKGLSKEEIFKQGYAAYLKSEKAQAEMGGKLSKNAKASASIISKGAKVVGDLPAELKKHLRVSLPKSTAGQKATDWSQFIED